MKDLDVMLDCVVVGYQTNGNKLTLFLETPHDGKKEFIITGGSVQGIGTLWIDQIVIQPVEKPLYCGSE